MLFGKEMKALNVYSLSLRKLCPHYVAAGFVANFSRINKAKKNFR